MEFILNRHVLKEYTSLFETPLPKEYEKDYLDQKESGNYNPVGIISKLHTDKLFDNVGSGSSRIAFRVFVDKSQFPKNFDFSDYNIIDDKVDTVIKLAKNEKGIAQNKREMENYKLAKKHNCDKYLLPIIDDNNSNKKLKLDKKFVSNWIQMPYAPEPNPDEFDDFMFYEFGLMTEIDRGDLHDLEYDFRRIEEKILEMPEDEREEEQVRWLKNINIMLDLKDVTGLIFGDIGRTSQWGVYNDRLYILDYGFDGVTTEYYSGSKIPISYVHDDGLVSDDETLLFKNIHITSTRMKKLVDVFKKVLKDLPDSPIPSLGKNKLEYAINIAFNYGSFDSDKIYIKNGNKNMAQYGIVKPEDLFNNYYLLSRNDISEKLADENYMNEIEYVIFEKGYIRETILQLKEMKKETK